MSRPSLLAVAALVAGLALPSAASAQTLTPWSHGLTLELFAGTATAQSAQVRPALGTSVGWRINPWISVQGSGAWLVARQQDEAFAAELKGVANLMRPGRVVPFVSGGVGLYRASFDAIESPLPDFYRRRLNDSAVALHTTFTDPSFVVGGGLEIFTGDHVSIKPDLSVRIVTRASETYAVTMAVVHVAYHFNGNAPGR